MKRTRFGVRPDYHTTEEINALAAEKGVIVFNTDLSVNQYWDGASWVSQNPQDAINELVNEHSQGYIGLLSDFYFDGTGTDAEIVIEQVDVWQDVIMTIHSQGISDQRVEDMKSAQTVGYEGDGSLGSPINFLLEGLVEASFATLRTSLDFTPDEDGGRLDSRLFLERHSEATPSEDFPINAAGLAMESGADEIYPHLVSVQFFVGDTINTNGVGDAGKIRFQVKSDVTGTVTMKEMALFINR